MFENQNVYYPANNLGGTYQVPPNPISLGMNGYNQPQWPNQPNQNYYQRPADPNPALSGMGGYYTGNYYSGLFPMYNSYQEELDKKRKHDEAIASSWKLLSRGIHELDKDITGDDLEYHLKQYDVITPETQQQEQKAPEFKSTMVISVEKNGKKILNPVAVEKGATAYRYLEHQQAAKLIETIKTNPNLVQFNTYGQNVARDHQKITERHNKFYKDSNPGFVEFMYLMKDIYIDQLKQEAEKTENIAELYNKPMLKEVIMKSRGTNSFYGNLYQSSSGFALDGRYRTLSPTGTFSTERAKELNISDMAVTLPDSLKPYAEKKQEFINFILNNSSK